MERFTSPRAKTPALATCSSWWTDSTPCICVPGQLGSCGSVAIPAQLAKLRRSSRCDCTSAPNERRHRCCRAIPRCSSRAEAPSVRRSKATIAKACGFDSSRHPVNSVALALPLSQRRSPTSESSFCPTALLAFLRMFCESATVGTVCNSSGGHCPRILGTRRVVPGELRAQRSRAPTPGGVAGEGRRAERRVIARTVAVVARGGRAPAERPTGPRRGGRPTCRVGVGDIAERGFERPRGIRRALEVEHPAGGVPIQRPRRTAHHLGAPHTLEIDEVHRGLPIGLGERNAIAGDANAANAEGRARAEAANGQPGILRGIVAVGDREPRDIEERLGERGAPDAGSPRIHREPGDAERKVERGTRRLARHRHPHRLKSACAGRVLPGEEGGNEQRDARDGWPTAAPSMNRVSASHARSSISRASRRDARVSETGGAVGRAIFGHGSGPLSSNQGRESARTVGLPRAHAGNRIVPRVKTIRRRRRPRGNARPRRLAARGGRDGARKRRRHRPAPSSRPLGVTTCTSPIRGSRSPGSRIRWRVRLFRDDLEKTLQAFAHRPLARRLRPRRPIRSSPPTSTPGSESPRSAPL